MTPLPAKLAGGGEFVDEWNAMVACLAELRARPEAPTVSGGAVSGASIAIPPIVQTAAFRVPYDAGQLSPEFNRCTAPLGTGMTLWRATRTQNGVGTLTTPENPAEHKVYAPDWWFGSAIPGDFVYAVKLGGWWQAVGGGRTDWKITILTETFAESPNATEYRDLPYTNQEVTIMRRLYRGDFPINQALPDTTEKIRAVWTIETCRWEIITWPCL